ncbi:hypothetical protein K2Q16_01460 [Patescibacteria group bacterium]|nr:hypothetical protein [Patescibacteria group bacterium]
MATEHAYGATILNNATESSAVAFLLESNSLFKIPTHAQRISILERFKLAKTFARAFDLVLVPPGTDLVDPLTVPLDQIILVELKTTRKRLPENPKGFFFGATENEFKLAEQLGDQFRFCFVSLHPETKSYALLTAKELHEKVRTKRLQYQVNLY